MNSYNTNQGNNKCPDILLITPPVWDVHLPFAAVPQLMGACKRAGLKSMQVDFGILAFRIHFNRYIKEKIKRFQSRKYYDDRVACWKDSPVKTYEEYLASISFLSEADFSVDKAKTVYLNGGILEKGIISALIDAILGTFSTKTSNGVFNVTDFFEEGDSGIIDECIECEGLLSLLQSDIKLVGISITGIVQYRYAKELINAIRKINPKLKIVLGGSAITLAVKSNAANIQTLLGYADFLVTGEGETPIVQLAKYILGERIELDTISGIIYSDSIRDGGVFSNQSSAEWIETVAMPCFDGINFNQYVLPEPMFPYHASRGCFYGQCAFCNHDPEYRHNYREKSVDKVISEILILVAQTGIRNVQFTDEALEPHFFKRLVCAMEENLEFRDISWFCYLRVSNLYDDETVKIAAKNGCKLVMFGIESFQQRLLNFIKKGINAETAKKNLNLFHRHGIKTYSWFMYGLPSETMEEALKDVDEIKGVSECLDGFSAGGFHLSANTDMTRETEKYNILDYDIYNGLSFSTHNNGNPIDVGQVRQAYKAKKDMFERENYFSSNRYLLFFSAKRNNIKEGFKCNQR